MKTLLCLMLLSFSMLAVSTAFANVERSKVVNDRTAISPSIPLEQHVMITADHLYSHPKVAVASFRIEVPSEVSYFITSPQVATADISADRWCSQTDHLLTVEPPDQSNNPFLHLDPGLK